MSILIRNDSVDAQHHVGTSLCDVAWDYVALDNFLIEYKAIVAAWRVLHRTTAGRLSMSLRDAVTFAHTRLPADD